VKGYTAAGSELAPVIFEIKFPLPLVKKAADGCLAHVKITAQNDLRYAGFQKKVAGYFLHSSTKARK